MNHRGSVQFMHNTLQGMIVDLLEQKYRVEKKRSRVHKEWSIPSKVEFGKEWIMDVADLTDPDHPVYYEIQQGLNPSFQAKMQEVARGTGFDVQAIYIEDLVKEVGKELPLAKIVKYLKERIV